MSRTLLLIRHAHTPPGTPDEFRHVSSNGETQATEMGARLSRVTTAPDCVVCSPAVRTLRTAELLMRAAGVPLDRIQQDRRLYESTLEDYLDVLHESLSSTSRLWVVGHNWAISSLAAHLSGDEGLSLSPCMVVKLDFRAESWGLANRNTLTGYEVFEAGI